VKKYFFIPLLLFTVLLAGCINKKIIDDVNITTGIGIDKEGEQYLGSAMIPVYNPDKSIENFIFTAKGTVVRDLMFQMQQTSSQPIVGGSLDVTLFDETVAREGIPHVLDVFLRDPSVGARVHLAVVDGKAKDIFEGKYGDRGNGRYLAELIESNYKTGNLPLTNLHQFLHDYYQKGKDPVLPYLRQTRPDLVNIAGLALFKGEKVVDVLDENKLFYFKLMVDYYSEGALKIKDEHGESFIKSIHSTYNFKVKNRNPYKFSVSLEVDGMLTEHTGKSLEKGEIKRIEKQMEKQIKKECLALLERFQENKIDPVGIGHFIKTQTRNFDIKKWEESYQNASFDVDAKVKIVEVGVIE